MAFGKTLLVYLAFNIAFLASAGLLIAFPIATKRDIDSVPTIHNVAQDLLLDLCPLRASIATGILMVLTFSICIPAMILKQNRILLKIDVAAITACALTTLGVGLAIWFDTLKTKTNLSSVWSKQDTLVTSMLQYKFQCCGYRDATMFVVDATCPNAADAARHGLCVGPFSAYANKFLDVVFTAMFGICAVDGLLILSSLCVLKERSEQARYRLIDEKNGYGTG